MEEITFSDFAFEEARLREMAEGQGQKLDSQLKVRFYRHAELNTFKSQQEGRKIFDEFVYIQILMPANRLNVIDRRATPDDMKRFSRQYAAFLKGAEQLQTGTPVEHLPTITPSQVLELKALNVDTVEQLANLPDPTAQIMGTGGGELKRRAQVFLDRALSNETLAEENRALKAQLAEFLARAMQTTDTPEPAKITPA